MVVADGSVQREGSPCRDLVGYDQRPQGVARHKFRPIFRKGEHCGHHRTADMALGLVEPIMRVKVVNLSGRGKGCPRDRSASAIKHHGGCVFGRTGAVKGKSVITRNTTGCKASGSCCHTHRIDQKRRSNIERTLRNIPPRQNEVGDQVKSHSRALSRSCPNPVIGSPIPASCMA